MIESITACGKPLKSDVSHPGAAHGDSRDLDKCQMVPSSLRKEVCQVGAVMKTIRSENQVRVGQ